MNELPMVTVVDHPLLDLRLLYAEFPESLGQSASTAELQQLLALGAAAPLASNDEVRRDVRDLLRQGGFKPTGRNKPASEFLIKAASENMLSSINLAVDVCNAVSLHSGLPISVVDLDLVAPPLRISIAEPGTAYIFNQSGQTIELAGLLCLFDAQGATANAVRDSQRTKTSDSTRRTLSCLWGTKAHPQRSDDAAEWYRSLLQAHGVSVQSISPHA